MQPDKDFFIWKEADSCFFFYLQYVRHRHFTKEIQIYCQDTYIRFVLIERCERIIGSYHLSH